MGFQLPSGLWQKYEGLEKIFDAEGKAQYQYKTRRGVVKVYGGKVVENICQAVARCVIAEQMLLIAKKYKVVLTVHDAVACIAWSGDAFQLAAENEGKFDFAIPESGGTISADNFIIPSTVTAETKPKVEELINYYYDPMVAAKVAAYVNYICPVQGAQEAMAKVDPSLVNNELIFPTAKTQSKLHVFRNLTPAEETEFTDAFQKATGN